MPSDSCPFCSGRVSAPISMSIFPALPRQAAVFHIHVLAVTKYHILLENYLVFSPPNTFSSVGMTGLMKNFLGWIPKLVFKSESSTFLLFYAGFQEASCIWLHLPSKTQSFWRISLLDFHMDTSMERSDRESQLWSVDSSQLISHQSCKSDIPQHSLSLSPSFKSSNLSDETINLLLALNLLIFLLMENSLPMFHFPLILTLNALSAWKDKHWL